MQVNSTYSLSDTHQINSPNSTNKVGHDYSARKKYKPAVYVDISRYARQLYKEKFGEELNIKNGEY
jgi:hypothetical protein